MTLDDWRIIAWIALGWAVMCTALLIIALGSIDAMREELAKERAMRQVRHIKDQENKP